MSRFNGSYRGTLRYGSFEEAFRKRGGAKGSDAGRARGLARYSDIVRVTAEGCYVVSYPLESLYLIEQAVVAGRPVYGLRSELIGCKKTEYADEVLELYPAETSAEARRQWAEIYSAVFFTYGHWCLTNQANALDIPAYEYCFCKHNGSLGPWHSGEMIYCYGNIPKDSRLYDEADRELSDIFCSYFANFCKTGDPNGEDLPLWERSSTGNELLKLGDSVEMIRDPFLKIYPVFDRFYGAS